MRYLLITLFFATLAHSAEPRALDPLRVAVLYNSSVEKSAILARDYAKARGIPDSQVIGLPIVDKATLTRTEFQDQIRDPLRAKFSAEGWWRLAKDAQGIQQPIERDIDVLVCMKGVPYRIARAEAAVDPNHANANPQFGDKNEASVDSELCYIGISGLPLAGPLQNQYFKKEEPFAGSGLTHMILVGRIDGPTWADCARMIKDAFEVERTGLWGRCYLDQSGKYPLGDQWLKTIESRNIGLGIQTVMDANKDSFLTAYPMTDAAIYYGWYDFNKSGPWLNPDFRLKKGAVAVHLHSFSAEKLRSTDERWTGPIIASGAAATVGNVWEPYLQMTHHFDIMHKRLTQGYTLIESTYMALPVVSWNSLVIGDPFYRPFKHLMLAKGKVTESDRPYRVLRAATMRWGMNAAKRDEMIDRAAVKKNEGIFFEDRGLACRRQNLPDQAIDFFTSARLAYGNGTADALRCDLHIIDISREKGDLGAAVSLLRTISPRYDGIPESAALLAIRTILDPPQPETVRP